MMQKTHVQANVALSACVPDTATRAQRLADWLSRVYFRFSRVHCSHALCERDALARMCVTITEADPVTSALVANTTPVYLCERHLHEFNVTGLLPYHA